MTYSQSKHFLLYLTMLITTFPSFAQTAQPDEKIDKEPNTEWSSIPQWYSVTGGKQFSFVKNRVSKLKTCKDGSNSFLDSFQASNYLKFNTITSSEKSKMLELAEKYYLGATIIKTPNDTVGEYIKLIDIPETDSFVIIATAGIKPKYNIVKSRKREEQDPFNSSKTTVYYVPYNKTPYYSGFDEYYINKSEAKLLIQNLKTKLYYVLNIDAFQFSYGQCDNLKYNDLPHIYKELPKNLSLSEKDLLIKYKSLIKSGGTNIDVLLLIQKKYLTKKGYFDSDRVSLIDKKKYNQTLESLKITANKLSEIDSNEDKDDKIQDKLTIEESGILDKINEWNNNVFKLY